jgi:hypothetical protein
MQGWKTQTEAELTAENLARLFANEISTIRIPGFATPAECRAVADAMRGAGFQDYGHGRPVHFIGTTQFNFRFRPRAEYFAEVPTACAAQGQVFARSFDAVERMMEHLRRVHGGAVGIASEPDGTRYFAGILRKTVEGGSLHADWAPATAPGYAVAGLDAQVTWNLYVEALDQGGATTLYDRVWEPPRPAGEVSDNYGLDDSLVAGARAHVFAPTVGDVVMFNTRNMHRVGGGPRDSQGLRLQVGSFIGRLPGGNLVLWS